MASRPSPNSLIHCAVCGEDYSATYKRCPFCGAKNTPAAPNPGPYRAPAPDPEPEPAPPPSRSVPERDPDDTYVFDGQDLFDDEPEDDYRPVRPKGGKRLAEKPSSSPFAAANINWPRMITYLCSLIIIVAALVIVFTVIYPQLRGGEDPVMSATDAPETTAPVGEPTQPAGPAVTGSVDPVDTDPPVDPSDGPVVGPGEEEPTGLTLNKYDITLNPGESFQLVATITPADWSGTVTYESSDTSLMTVSAAGLIAHAKPDMATGVRGTKVTVRAGTLEAVCTVYIAGASNVAPSTPPVTETDPPVDPTDPPVDPGTITVGSPGVIINADGGLRVRSGPGTTFSVIASLKNGDRIVVLEAAEGGWYKISFAGAGGAATEGYILGEYISTN